MAHYSRAGGRSPDSFAQTTAEFTIDDSDDDDLRSAISGGGGGGDAYEMRDRSADRRRRRLGGGSSAIWDAELDGDEDHDDDDHDHDHDGDHDHDPLVSRDGRGRRRRRRHSAASAASFELYTPDEEMRVRRKFDRRLVLFVALLYLLSFLDRSNIGNARIAGMDEDLRVNSPPLNDWYEWSLTAFYITYIAFEWMSLLFTIVPAHILISLVVMTWGLTASLQAITPSYPVLIALRALLGIGEAGFTGIPFYMSFFFKREELAFRTAIFISAAPLATSFASTLAWVIVKFAEFSPIAPWRLLFIIEGLPSVLAGVAAWTVLPDSPQTASYLTKREKRVARLRLRKDRSSGSKLPGASSSSSSSGKPATSGFHFCDVAAAVCDPVAWITASMFFLTNMAFSSLPVFLPKILHEMGHDTLTSQALSAPPFLAAFFVVLLTSHMSDRLRTRTVPIVAHALFSASGYAVLALAKPLGLPPFLRYLAVYPAAIGFFNVVALVITWNINNQASESRQGTGFALLQIVGQCGPLVGTRLYPDAGAPYYASGMAACAGAMVGVSVLAFCLRLYLMRLNRQMDQAANDRLADGTSMEEEGLVGPGKRRCDTASTFRYML